MKRIILLLVIAVVLWTWFTPPRPVSLGPGVMAPDAPVQIDISAPTARPWDDYLITDVATFELQAKVLAKKNYSFDRGADLSPTDLALGWGAMSDETVLADIDISQSGRFYRWRVETFPIPRKEITSSSANMHLIPANETVEAAIDRIRPGEIIALSGTLVNVTAKESDWRWNSSRTRTDSGGGACELIWVDSIRTVLP